MALLPKNLEEEGPIALTPYLAEGLQLSSHTVAPSQSLARDYVVASMTVMDLALARLIRAEAAYNQFAPGCDQILTA